MRNTAILLALAALAACEHSPPGAAAPVPLTDADGALLLDGLGEFGPLIREAMETRTERAARAPYSPPGWPLRRGEDITRARRRELDAAFPETCGIKAPFWVGDRVFGAAWRYRDPYAGVLLTADMEYVGHYREYIGDWVGEYDSWECRLPPHLGVAADGRYGRVSELPAALVRIPYNEKVVRDGDNNSEHPPYWTRELWLAGYTGEDDRRAQREALGLPLPEPWPDKETMFYWWQKCNEANGNAAGVIVCCRKPEPILVRGVEIWH